MSDILVEVKEVVRDFYLGGEHVRALSAINLDIYQGEYISIMGPSGSGKSTLFNMIGGLDKPTSGEVFISGININSLSAREMAWLRCNNIGYIFQSYNLMPVLSALDNITLPMTFAGVDDAEAIEKATKLLEQVGLGERIHHNPSELSGGQQQRVAIARSLANDPRIILADEPTANLDLNTGKDIIELLKKLSVENGVTVISATHDFKMLSVSDRIVRIRDGQIEKIENRDEIEITEGAISDH